ncbi:MAG: hypothetical protein PWP73_929 [Methanococcus sp.]|jgi:hypothetical protein|uniref:Uncharacterized protein n=1 Tax=Methanococcus maripaludis X1 TaxID=1053692 RepID=G0H4L0_METMI|nr:hypothetical protein GYY_03810 [Methanococcus maripaludis X1]MDK2929332.1 hypothetical protein [Methanococcus sp.]
MFSKDLYFIFLKNRPYLIDFFKNEVEFYYLKEVFHNNLKFCEIKKFNYWYFL